MSDFVIETIGLCKSFKGQPALNGLDLNVPAGSIFGFLGRNGAGKTTLGLSEDLCANVSYATDRIDLWRAEMSPGLQRAVMNRTLRFWMQKSGSELQC